MTNHRKIAVCAIAFLVLLAIFIEISEATTLSITVPAGEEVTRKINLVVDDHVLIRFTVLGTSGSKTVTFTLSFPNPDVDIKFGETGAVSYSFVVDVEGEYTLHFANSDTTESKLVTLNYEIDHYILGIPQMLFLALVIAVLCVAMVASYVLMSRRP